MKKLKHVGIDIGSTTAKTVVLDHELQQIYSEYTRHHTNIKETTVALLKNICTLENTEKVTVTVTGSAGTAVSKRLSLPYMQEVLACTQAVEFLLPDTDVAIELGGEDAKITFFKGGLEQRMNGTCAGGTGAFIDQMAVLLNTDAKGLDQLAKS
ncbi:MAG TPA: 2-hydroxyglutaryl-CoA dehydratase, partial [Clostridiales bacterium]|nr:2-hydroxyglutaryl-CoA dehydratase [Clostridiales bacterium]